MATEPQVIETDEEETIVGRLSSFGVQEPWQAALLMPTQWDDLSNPSASIAHTHPDEETRMVLVARALSEPQKVKGGLPRHRLRLIDADGTQIEATIWGERAIANSVVPGKRQVFDGKLKYWDGRPQFTINEVLDTRYLGRFRPVYPGKPKVINAETVRQRVLSLLVEAIPEAVNQIKATLDPHGGLDLFMKKIEAKPNESLESLLWLAHLPETEAEGVYAQGMIEKIAALEMLYRAQKEVAIAEAPPMSLKKSDMVKRTDAIPFALTDEQELSIDEIVEDMRRPIAMRRLLTGDVGTGKTAVYGTAAAVAADSGARVAILLPNVVLANQVHKEMATWWPDLDICLVEAGGGKKRKAAANAAQIIIGTTALLKADAGPRDLVIVDEQQKFSKEQREALVNGHFLEVSATMIPRTQALLNFGIVDISRLSKGHVKKDIKTKIWKEGERSDLFRACLKSVHDHGHQLAIIYPSKDGEKEESTTIKSATVAAESWEKHFPGRVRLVHGGLSSEQKSQAITDMKENRADVLVSTTVIEVGVTIPGLRRLTIIDAERHGLTTLHQLRGRVARHGGEGAFDLYLSDPVVQDHIINRLSILEKTTDGNAIAEHDLMLRGYGELSGSKQHGEVGGILIGRAVDTARLSAVAATMTEKREKPMAIPFADHGQQTALDDGLDEKPSHPTKHATQGRTLFNF
jgi:ATP-dependent DNA helicase RecG